MGQNCPLKMGVNRHFQASWASQPRDAGLLVRSRSDAYSATFQTLLFTSFAHSSLSPSTIFLSMNNVLHIAVLAHVSLVAYTSSEIQLLNTWTGYLSVLVIYISYCTTFNATLAPRHTGALQSDFYYLLLLYLLLLLLLPNSEWLSTDRFLLCNT